MNLYELVDATHGRDRGGNCIPGPYLPRGMAMPSPDAPGNNNPHGYGNGGSVARFSANHVNGTGGNGRYGNCSVMPFVGTPNLAHPPFPLTDEVATVGHYSCALGDTGIRHELTATQHVAVHRTTFPSREHGFVFDAGSHIVAGDSVKPVAGLVEWLNDHEVQGWSIIKGGWGHEVPYQIHFFVRFSTPCSRRQVVQNGATGDGYWADGPGPMAIAWFDERRVEVRVGISQVSVANARVAVDREADASFDELVGRNRDAWEAELAVIQCEGEPDLVREVASSLYRLHGMPTDLGLTENPWWHSPARNFTDYYCLWDSVRNANSLLMLIKPDLQAQMIEDLVDIGRHRGWLPDAWIAGHSAHVQGGISAAIIVAEAAAKGLTGIDYGAAFEQLVHDSQEPSPDEYIVGRYAKEWCERGWLPDDVYQGLSKSIEYSYQDHCLSGLARRLGHDELAEQFARQASTLWELWNPEHRCFTPRKRDGRFVVDYDSWRPTRPDFWYDPYCYEGSAQEWSLTPLHLISGIIERHGGAAAFCDHLDQLIIHRRYVTWKEIILHVPWLPYDAGMPERSVPLLRSIRELYGVGPDGMPDNEDFGCQSTFAIGMVTGLYPVMGQDRYWVSSPLVTKSTWALPGGSLRIRCPKADGTFHEIDELRLNGTRLDRLWVHHHEIAIGGELEVMLR